MLPSPEVEACKTVTVRLMGKELIVCSLCLPTERMLSVSIYIGAVAGRAGQVSLRGTYAAVVAVDIVTNIVEK